MATVIPSAMIGDIRGKVGDQVFGRNKGGLYVRERVDPTQPASAHRDATQAAFTAISQAWSGTLTQAHRDTWLSYGRQHLLPDRWGRMKAMSGICHFIRSNAQRYRTETAITATFSPELPPPPVPAFTFRNIFSWQYTMTGTLSPDATGTYKRRDDYDGIFALNRDDSAYFVWFDRPSNKFVISAVLGTKGAAYWDKAVPVAGNYTAQGTATGTPNVTQDFSVTGVRIDLPPLNYTDATRDVHLFAYAGEPVTAGRNYYSTPWRFIGTALRSSSTWSPDPWYLDTWSPSPFSGKVFLRLVAVLADGATSIRGQASANIES